MSADPVEEYLGDQGRSAGGASELGRVLSGVAVVGAEVGELREKVARLTAQLDPVRTRLAELTDHTVDTARLGELHRKVDALAALADQVADLSDAVAALADNDQGDALRPVDWAHLPPGEQGEVLQELVEWVRDVLFVGWPSARPVIRPCWPQHTELLNAMLWLRCAYQTTYDNPHGRAHHAADFHRTLREVLERCQILTEHCPPPGAGVHVVPIPPRDDSPALAAAARTAAIGQIYDLNRHATNDQAPPDAREQALARANELWTAYRIRREEYEAYEEARRVSEDLLQPTVGRARRPTD